MAEFIANSLNESLIAEARLVFTLPFGLVGVTSHLPQLLLQRKFSGLGDKDNAN